MKENKKVILDFDERYKSHSPGEDIIVLSNTYETPWTIDVRKFRDNISADVEEYTAAWEDLIIKSDEKLKDTLKACEASFFRTVVNPFSRWTEALDKCIRDYNVTNISFTSYVANHYIFKYEAEGETNVQFLYKKNYYLPFYLKKYLENKDYSISFQKTQGALKVKFLSHIRNFLMVSFVLLKQFLYKMSTFKRKYGSFREDSKVLISSRAIVQTDFISNFLKYTQNDSVLIINEQSLRPFKHLKYAKNNNFNFLYAEGNLRFRDFIKMVESVFVKCHLAKKNSQNFIYKNININSKHFLYDLICKELDYMCYAFAVRNSLPDIRQDSTLMMFEMFTPHSFYVRKYTGVRTLQVQTTLVDPVPSPNLVGSDLFYFTSPISHSEFIKSNPLLAPKIGCIPYLKYIGSARKNIENKLEKIAYFTQPIDLDEEKSIILFLADYCKRNSVDLIIKPHPRQANIATLFKGLYVTDPAESNEKIIKDADIVVTRSSSIGLDAWIFGTPCVFVKLNNFLQSQNFFFAPADYAGTVTSLNKLHSLLDNYTELYERFKAHELYLETSVTNVDIKSFLNEK